MKEVNTRIGNKNRLQKMLTLSEELLAIAEERLRGAKYYSVEEVDDFLEAIISDKGDIEET